MSELIFKGVELREENRIGEEGQGFPILIDMLDSEGVVVSASLVGGARTCLEIAARYSMEREVFHRPLRHFEAISFRVAEMACRIEAAKADS